MKSLLIISHLGHSSPRIPGLCKYLADLGWSIFIITPPLSEEEHNRLIFSSQNDKLNIIETKKYFHKGPMKINGCLSFLEIIVKANRAITKKVLINPFEWPDYYRRWIHFAMSKGLEFIKHQKIDLILSSSSPVSCHFVARKISVKMNMPWIADFRDLWTQNHNYQYSYFRFVIELIVEKKLMKKISNIISV